MSVPDGRCFRGLPEADPVQDECVSAATVTPLPRPRLRQWVVYRPRVAAQTIEEARHLADCETRFRTTSRNTEIETADEPAHIRVPNLNRVVNRCSRSGLGNDFADFNLAERDAGRRLVRTDYVRGILRILFCLEHRY